MTGNPDTRGLSYIMGTRAIFKESENKHGDVVQGIGVWPSG